MVPQGIGGPGLGHALGLADAWQNSQQGKIANGKPVKLPVGTIPYHFLSRLNFRGQALRDKQSAEGLPVLFGKHLNHPR